MFIQISHISKSYSEKEVLKNISFTINSGERTALVGKNGSGKSTIFKVIAGLAHPDDGYVSVNPKNTAISYIPQAPEFNEHQTVVDMLSESIENVEKYKVDLALVKLGIEDLKNKQLTMLSSGQKTRIFLARLIINEPEVLLLDEPTNHLDIEALEWLENYIRKYQGSIFVISHDRRFLDNTVNKIVELEDGAIKIYGGNYSFYREQKQIEFETNEQAYESQQKGIKRLEREAKKQKTRAERIDKDRKPKRDNDSYAPAFFANRASKKISSASKAIEMRLAHLDRIERPKKDMQLRALFKPKNEGSRTILSLKNVSKNFGNALVLSEVSSIIVSGERMALTGPNGSGKSTLIKIVLGEIEADSGLVEVGNNVNIGYLSQEHNELDSDNTVINELMMKTDLDKTNAYKLLVRFLIPVNKVNQPVRSLSSGEKAKLLLAQVMASGANFIILDEPTNHLDIPSREALEEALVNYDGALLVVSHDRYFTDKIGLDRFIQL